jgi:hypothetical protein
MGFPPASGKTNAAGKVKVKDLPEPPKGKSLKDSIAVKDAAVAPPKGIQNNGDPQVNQF